MVDQTGQTERESETGNLIIDCDVHQDWKSSEELVEYLPEHFQSRGVTPAGGRGYASPIGDHGFLRDDAIPESGGLPGSSYEKMEEQLFGAFNVNYAVLTGSGRNYSLQVHPNVDYAKAAVEAYNDWLIDRWLDCDDRLLGSLCVVPHAPEHAAEEIRRVGTHPQMVQVLMPSAHEKPYGQRNYWPIYEAAEETGLPVALHGGVTGNGVAANPRTGAGVARSYFEKHVTAPGPHMGQLASIIIEGVFERFPNLDWIFIESGIGWVPGMMWRLDKCWKGLKDAAPWLEHPPSEYIRENVWFTTQPIAEPETVEQLRQLFDMIHADETLLFSSDYPHWDNDNPKRALDGLSAATKRQIFEENARRIYDL